MKYEYIKKDLNPFDKFFREFVMRVLQVHCKLFYHLKVYGAENVPLEGSTIFCGNHNTLMDAVFIKLATPRDMRFMAKSELSKNGFLRYLGRIMNVIFVNRDSKDLTAIKESLGTLKAGDCLGIFPEGTRHGLEKNDGQLKNGASYLALKTKSNIVPIGVINNGFFRRSYVVFGKPLDLSKYDEVKKIGDVEEQEVSDMLKNEIIRLSSPDEIKLLSGK
ncbi:MAG: 1-acyl-sn-glycerol-3-phosphate acyltransferase [Clostridia bacterium]|nr:1-acyl-sn-glycerol-3-phosphate acyltransferase [Clostridia bacterium]